MRVGLVTTWFERGAAYVSRQFRDLLAAEHEVRIFARGGEAYAVGDPRWDGPDVTWASRLASEIPTEISLPEFEDWLSTEKIEVVLFNEQWWWPAVLLARRRGVPTGAYIDYYTEQTVPFFAAYDFLICCTQRHLSAFDWHPAAKYLKWGTDLRTFSPREARPDVLTFFHSAGVSPHRKGCDLVIRAFLEVQGACRLVIHSQRRLREQFPELRTVIDQLEAAGRLELHERTVPAPGLFHLGDVYVYPTRLEGIGLTIMEAAASGLPVIVTDAPPMSEFIRHDDNGRLVEVERLVSRPDGYYWPQAYASRPDLTIQMQWYVDHAAELPALRARAREVAVSEFDWSRAGPSLARIVADARAGTDPLPPSLLRDIEHYSAEQRRQHRMTANARAKRLMELKWPAAHATAVRLRDLLRRRQGTQP